MISGRKKCDQEKSLMYVPLFNASKMTSKKIFLLTLEIYIGTKTIEIMKQYEFGSTTLTDWEQFINEKFLGIYNG